ncbi:hypothetical protein C9J21_21790 [Photobacterium phosphoreum]|uniref:hypothetical protein n=1 Tax=Photobacterium phosphoreum TaxID=659 RepID=UPI000D17C75D|nr:hypothetical protein [Photobacterium phosphoreum]PSW25209.1 hypothetical protein C9J21_21790 [Photobacterium phosphoreum]
MNTITAVEFFASRIDNVIAARKYSGDMLLTISQNDTELAFSDGYRAKGKVLNFSGKEAISLLINSDIFNKNFTTYRIELANDKTRVIGKKIKLRNYIY